MLKKVVVSTAILCGSMAFTAEAAVLPVEYTLTGTYSPTNNTSAETTPFSAILTSPGGQINGNNTFSDLIVVSTTTNGVPSTGGAPLFLTPNSYVSVEAVAGATPKDSLFIAVGGPAATTATPDVYPRTQSYNASFGKIYDGTGSITIPNDSYIIPSYSPFTYYFLHQLTLTEVLPEPGSISLIGGAAVMLLARRRHRNNLTA